MARGYPGTKGSVKKAQAQYGVDGLDLVSIERLLAELHARGGTLRAVANAQMLVLRKSADYNQGGMKGQTAEDAATADRDVYFPFGLESYVQMIHTKAQRLLSLAKKQRSGLEPNFEGVRDTSWDLINYASFLLEWMDRQTVVTP